MSEKSQERVLFPALQTAIFVGKLVAGLIAGLGVLVPTVILMEGSGIGATTLGLSLGTLLLGVFAFAFFEFLSVVTYIERNTRDSKAIAEQILEKLSE